MRLLGAVGAFGGDNQPLDVGGPQRRALLAMLALAGGRVVASERIVDGLWSHPPESAVQSVQVHVSRLRKALGNDAVSTHGQGYSLQLGPSGRLDVADFDRLIVSAAAATKQGDGAKTREDLHAALALWRGPPLADIADYPFAAAVTAELEERHKQAIEDLVEARLSLGEHAELISELETHVRDEPWRERRWGQLILAYYRSERQADALATYRRARSSLVEGLGIEPGEPLRRLEAAILSQDSSLLASDPAVAAPRPAFRPTSWAPAEPQLVGRERELERLVNAFEGLAEGRRPLIAIGGEPGIGKTRLAQELSDRSAARGALVAWGRCYEAEATAPYRPIVSALRALIDVLPAGWIENAIGAREADLAILLPELVTLAAAHAADKPTGDERLRVFDSVTAFLGAVAKLAPLVLVFDDLHAADRSSIALLDHLICHIDSDPILIAATFRTTQTPADHPLGAWLDRARHERELERIDLGGLGVAEVGELFAALCGSDSVGDRGDAIAGQTGGNPFFVRELAVHYTRKGSAFDLASDPLPENLLAAMDQRVARLGPDCRTLLQRLAVAPGGAPVRLLTNLGLGSLEEVLSVVEEAIQAGIVRERLEQGTTTVEFAHPLFRQATLGRISATRRAHLHHDLAGAITQMAAPERDPWLGDLAYHTFSAGRLTDPGEVIEICEQAGDVATARTAFHDALTHYQHALEAVSWIEDVPSQRRARLQLGCAKAHRSVGDADAARRMAETAFADAAAVADADVMAEAALVHAGARSTYAQMDERTSGLLERALAALTDTEDERQRTRVLSRLTQEHYIGGNYETARELGAEAVRIARASGDDGALAAALEGQVWALHAPETLDERMTAIEQLIECAGRAGERDWLMLGLIWRESARLEIGDVDGLDADLERLQELSAMVRTPSHVFRIATMRATRAMMAGDWEQGAAFAQEAYRIGLPVEPANADQVLRAQLLGMMREHNLLVTMAPLIEQMADVNSAAPGWGSALAFVYTEAGMVDRARAQLELLGSRGFARVPRDLAWLLGFCYLAEVIAALGDDARAKEVYSMLLPYADRNASVFEIASAGSVSHFVGLLARTFGDLADAEHHLQAAIAFNDRTGQRPAAARSRYEYARLVLEPGQGPREELGARGALARELLADALKTADALGLERLKLQAGPIHERLARGDPGSSG